LRSAGSGALRIRSVRRLRSSFFFFFSSSILLRMSRTLDIESTRIDSSSVLCALCRWRERVKARSGRVCQVRFDEFGFGGLRGRRVEGRNEFTDYGTTGATSITNRQLLQNSLIGYADVIFCYLGNTQPKTARAKDVY
jgi:hypothetical protein